ncbi:MAG: hypothetical protein H6710_00445 [Myxococcales bacterium]|nr:hypothetical protein [Myxococcales bacterium]MCB9703150.1 hypothetical protein [Myxococcales bacterium]
MTRTRALTLTLALFACGDDSTSSGTSGPTSTGLSTSGAPTTSGAGSTASSDTGSGGGSSSGGGTSSTGGGSTAAESEGTGTSSTSAATASTGADTSGGVTDTDTDTGVDPGKCMIADVEDTLAFNYVKTIDLVDIDTIQASFYNIAAKEIVFFSFYGEGRRFTIDGEPIGDVMAPPEALPSLDGGSYDQVNEVALLVNQGCRLVEADPITLETLKAIQLDTVKFKIGVCAGVAIGVDGDMYVISWQTEEMVKMTRDGQTELGRVDLAALGLSRPDGVSLIAGSENFLVLSSTNQQAAILAPDGTIVVPPGPVGKAVPPFKGGGIPNSDASLTVCGNGHAWLCEEYGTHCHDFAPEDGDKDACACTIPQ